MNSRRGCPKSQKVSPKRTCKKVRWSVRLRKKQCFWIPSCFSYATTLTLKIQQISEDIASIRETLLEKNLDSAKVAEEEFIFLVPTDSLASFENFEGLIENKREYEKFVTYLQKIGGNTVYDCVKRIHSRILADEIAFEYNWHGLKGKKSFKDSFLAKATIEAIMRNKHIVASEKNIEEAIKSWLRHAKDRWLRRGPADKENIVPD
ncbi:hypothetical protein JTB14_003549 [Gonioctena quinquepunctata]|nr:hypothetical protein JTB14_003549 [Gonioctena quinquepunctata]